MPKPQEEFFRGFLFFDGNFSLQFLKTWNDLGTKFPFSWWLYHSLANDAHNTHSTNIGKVFTISFHVKVFGNNIIGSVCWWFAKDRANYVYIFFPIFILSQLQKLHILHVVLLNYRILNFVVLERSSLQSLPTNPTSF